MLIGFNDFLKYDLCDVMEEKIWLLNLFQIKSLCLF